MVFTCNCGAVHNVECDAPGVSTIKVDTLEQSSTHDDIMLLRKLLWLRHGCSMHFLYGDDGEMQCSRCLLDFKRTPVVDIQKRFEKINLQGIVTKEKKDES